MKKISSPGQLKRKSSSDLDDFHGSLQKNRESSSRKQTKVTIMHVCPPVMVRVSPCDFRLAVQKLTGFNQEHGGCQTCDVHHHHHHQINQSVLEENQDTKPFLMHTTTKSSGSISSSSPASSHSYEHSNNHTIPPSDDSSSYYSSAADDNRQENESPHSCSELSFDQIQSFVELSDDVSTLDCYHPSLDHLHNYDALTTPRSIHLLPDLDFSIIDSYCPSLDNHHLELIVS